MAERTHIDTVQVVDRSKMPLKALPAAVVTVGVVLPMLKRAPVNDTAPSATATVPARLWNIWVGGVMPGSARYSGVRKLAVVALSKSSKKGRLACALARLGPNRRAARHGSRLIGDSRGRKRRVFGFEARLMGVLHGRTGAVVGIVP